MVHRSGGSRALGTAEVRKLGTWSSRRRALEHFQFSRRARGNGAVWMAHQQVFCPLCHASPPPCLCSREGWQRPHSEAGWDLGYFSLPCPCRDPVERIKRVSTRGQNLHGASAQLPVLSGTEWQGEAQRHGTWAQALLGELGAGTVHCWRR